ncbi:MAG: hypothetical protein HYV08_08145 [Deltaproteobacteria bacterium]|nr:hypothetical protein [Deltaproteobacteria bacterium]
MHGEEHEVAERQEQDRRGEGAFPQGGSGSQPQQEQAPEEQRRGEGQLLDLVPEEGPELAVNVARDDHGPRPLDQLQGKSKEEVLEEVASAQSDREDGRQCPESGPREPARHRLPELLAPEPRLQLGRADPRQDAQGEGEQVDHAGEESELRERGEDLIEEPDQRGPQRQQRDEEEKDQHPAGRPDLPPPGRPHREQQRRDPDIDQQAEVGAGPHPIVVDG